jgi:hypothetical protein
MIDELVQQLITPLSSTYETADFDPGHEVALQLHNAAVNRSLRQEPRRRVRVLGDEFSAAGLAPSLG